MIFDADTINEIENNEDRIENLIVYLDETDNSYYTIYEMYTFIQDDYSIHFDVIPYEYTEDGQLEFIKGFLNNAPDWYDFEKDTETPYPWCAPWEWNESKKELWFSDTIHPYDMGESYVEHMSEMMKAFFTEDDE